MNEDRDSLERYLKSRGAQILGHSMNRAGLSLQATVGGAILAVGVGVSLVSWATGAKEAIAAGLGPIFAGGLNLSIALGIRRRLHPETSVRVEMTREAKSLLLTLYREVAGWPATPFGFEGRCHRIWRRKRQRLLMLAGYGTSVPLPTGDVLLLLERAAAAYNRIAAAVAGYRELPSVAKMAPRVSLAADEAMSEIFHHAATLSRYPEGLGAGRGRIEAQIKALEEIALRLESLAASGANNLEPRLSSNVEDVLSELRFEQLARTELQAPDEARLPVDDL